MLVENLTTLKVLMIKVADATLCVGHNLQKVALLNRHTIHGHDMSMLHSHEVKSAGSKGQGQLLF